MWTADDHQWMQLAIRLAEQGRYTTTPNPRVGCVIVKDGQVIGQGAHLKAGEPHAEVHALRQAGGAAKGATAYVTLEPCSHHGKTPPCAEALVQAGVSKIIAAMDDPNPLVAGRGLAYLQTQGIITESGLLEAQAKALNPGFILRMTEQRPFVRLKTASSLDGKTALHNGESQWITSEAARRDVQHWRASSCAILTGINTILKDDPQLTVRAFDIGRQPLRVIVDSQLRIPLNAKVLAQGHALIAYAEATTQAQTDKLAALQDLGVSTVCLPNTQRQVDMVALLSELARRQCNEVMVEAGATLNAALLQTGMVDELLMYIAPMLMGHGAQGLFNWPDLAQMSAVKHLDIQDIRHVGPDIRLQARLRKA